MNNNNNNKILFFDQFMIINYNSLLFKMKLKKKYIYSSRSKTK